MPDTITNQLMQGLLTSLAQPTQQQQAQQQGVALGSLFNTGNPAAILAAQIPERTNAIVQATRGLMGLPAPKTAQDVLAGADLTTAEGMLKAADQLQTVNPNAALMLKMSAAQKAQEQQVQAQQVATQQVQRATVSNYLSDLATKEKDPSIQNALAGLNNIAASGAIPMDKLMEATNKIYERAGKDKPNERYIVAGNNVFDKVAGSWVPGAGPSDTAKADKTADPFGKELDPGKYDPTSFQRAKEAFSTATSPQDRQNALSLLRPALPAGEEYRNVNGKEVIYPAAGKPRQEALSQVNAFNNAREMALDKAKNAIAVTDNILGAINTGDFKPGKGAVLLGFVPGTEYWNQQKNIDTLLSNLGIKALQDMRTASTNGSSGFGQLTQKELQRLEDLVRNLSVGSTKEAFVDNLSKIRETFASVLAKDPGEQNIDKWVGIPSETAVTTSSGGRYKIVPRGQ